MTKVCYGSLRKNYSKELHFKPSFQVVKLLLTTQKLQNIEKKITKVVTNWKKEYYNYLSKKPYDSLTSPESYWSTLQTFKSHWDYFDLSTYSIIFSLRNVLFHFARWNSFLQGETSLSIRLNLLNIRSETWRQSFSILNILTETWSIKSKSGVQNQ